MFRIPFVLLVLAASACSGSIPPAAVPASTAHQEAIARIGDLTIRASAVPTATLQPPVAAQHGITRDDRTVMLLVGVRQGPEGAETSVPAAVTATAANLSGQRQTVAFRELRSGDLVDYVALVETSLPDTLRFDVTVVPAGASRTTLQFSREFHPR